MLSIKNYVEDELVIEKSKFITKLYSIDSFDEIGAILNEVKKEYKDATHHCYAYIYEEKKHFSDDGEPGGTAGMPILNVLESNSLDHILCVVIRYFGGIKLGAGGLVRAYTKGTVNALAKGTIVTMEKGYHVEIIFDYPHTKDVNYICKNIERLKESFKETISYEFLIEKERWNSLKEKLNPVIIQSQIIKEAYLKKS